MADAPQELWMLIEGYLAAERIELDDLELLGAPNKGRVLRVTIDGVDLDRLSALSRGISRLLDQDDLIPGSYRLEVSSPGLERKLRRPAHWRKAIGREVTIKTRTEIDGARRHDGRVRDADDEGAYLTVDGAERRIPFDQITSARTVHRWNAPAKPGKK